MQLKQKTKSRQDKDNPFGINILPNFAFNRGKQNVTHSVEKETPSNDYTLPNRAFNRGKQSVNHSVEKETPSNDHTLPDCVFNREKQSVARSREENDFPNNHDQQNSSGSFFFIPVFLSHRLSNSFFVVTCCVVLVFSLLFSLFYMFSCLLINTRRCIHFDFYMITSYLVPVPFFKCHGVWYTTVRLFVNNTNVPVSKWIFLHFLYFVLSPFVFLINFVTHVSLYLLLKWSHSFFSFKRYLPACPES